MNKPRLEAEFNRQTSKHRVRAAFRNGEQKLIFSKKLALHNRNAIWVHKERHSEIERLADFTGLPMTMITDALIRFALSQCYVVDDDGKDQDLAKYLSALMGLTVEVKESEDEGKTSNAEQGPRPSQPDPIPDEVV